MQPLEDAKQVFRIGHLETSPVVGDEVVGLGGLLVRTEFNASLRSPSRELPCVAQQVVKQDGQQPAVSALYQSICDKKLCLSLRLHPLQPCGGASGQTAQIDLLMPNFALGHACKRQQALD